MFQCCREVYRIFEKSRDLGQITMVIKLDSKREFKEILYNLHCHYKLYLHLVSKEDNVVTYKIQCCTLAEHCHDIGRGRYLWTN